MRGFRADDLFGTFQEAEAVSLGKKCQQYLFSLSLNPPQTANVSVEEFEAAIADIEWRLGLTGQPRAAVFHEKNGRRHAHCVWSRIDPTAMRAINLPHFKLRLTDISRELYLQHGWDMPSGLRNHDDRNPLSFFGPEASQAKRVKRDPAALKETFKAGWAASDSRTSFAAGLWEQGFCLARGDRRGFVAVDAEGEVYSLSRWIGVKAKDLRARFGDGDDLPSVEEARALLVRDSTLGVMREPTEQLALHLEEHGRKLADLVARQREERLALEQSQESRRITEIKARHARLPMGLKAIWAGLSGQYQRLCQDLADEAEACTTRDCVETQALIERHLTERSALTREQAFLQALQDFEQELFDKSEARRNPTYQVGPRQRLVLPREDLPFTARQLKRQPDLILGHISDKQARFTRTDILRGLAAFIDDPVELRAASDRAMLSHELVRVGIDEEIFATREYLAVEKQLLACAKEMAGFGGFKVNSAHFDRAITAENAKLQRCIGASLSDEQANAIHHILTPNQLSAVVGLAGAGKSTLLSVARQAWEHQGLRVHGAALAGKAVDSLQSASGIESRTLASLEASWKSGYERWSRDFGPVVKVDQLVEEVIQNDDTKEPFARFQGQGCA